jgi:replication factor A1
LSSTIPSDQFAPIRVLNNFSTDWKIKARIVKKYDKKEWSNAKGNGVLLNIDLMDKEGTMIQATFFNDAALKFDEILKPNQVYLFSNGQIKMANKKFSSIKNDHCITFDINAEIEPADDDKQIK